MNKNIKHIKISAFLTVIIMMILVAIYDIAFATEETNLEMSDPVVNSTGLTSRIVYGDRTIRTYTHTGSQGDIGSAPNSIQNVQSVLNVLNNHSTDPNTVLDRYASVFCLRHHQPLPTYTATLDRIQMGDVEVSNYITLNYDAGTATISQSKFNDIKQHDMNYTQTTNSNIEWKAFETDMKSVSTPYGSYGPTNAIVYAAAFSEKKTGNYLSGNYGDERAQQAIWRVVGEWRSGESLAVGEKLNKAGLCLDAYEAEADAHGADPKVTVGPQAGTILLGNSPSNYQYKIGPFNMSDYAYLYSPDAESYSGGLMGGLTAGVITLNNGTTIPVDGNICKIEYSDVGDNSRSGTNWNAPANYKFPWPNSTFYIVVNKSTCGDATTLSKVKFTYQSTRAEGAGWVLKSKFVQTTWNMVDIKDNSETYYCKASLDGHSCSGSSSSHNNGNPRSCSAHCTASKNYCVHGVWNGHHTDTCPKCTCDGKDKWNPTYTTNAAGEKVESGGYWSCTHSHSYCSTGYCSTPKYDGNHGTHTSTFLCSHGYNWCETFNWEAKLSVQYAQPLLAVNKAVVYVEEKDFEDQVDVRLTTDVSIDKYIIKVDHVAESGTIFGQTEERADKDTSWKNTNSVKVERGDRVTFKVVLKNEQDEEVQFKVRDILPNNYAYTITPDIKDWLVIPGNDQKEIIVTVDVSDKTGTHDNTAKIITRNRGNTGANSDSVDYARTTSRTGPVVNIAELESKKLEDADYFTIKEYNTSVDKNIVQVKHLGNNQITYSGNERKNIDEGIKNANPVYAEYGDEITYEIDIYNTTNPYEPNRNDAPYWDPDKVYVDIEDTLPQKYSNLKITVSNGTGSIGAVSGGKFRIDDIVVPKDGKTTVTVTLVVEEHNKTIKEKNELKIVGDILNINKKEIVNHPAKDTSADYYHLNDYDMSINKYIDQYNHEMTDKNNSDNFTNETTNFTDRSAMSETDKENKPLAVEKTETLRYAIRLDNNAVSVPNGMTSAVKPATSVRPTDVTDVLDYGLEYQSSFAKVYKADGSDKYGDLPITVSDLGNNTYKFTVPNTTPSGDILIVDPGEYLIYYVTVKVTETNMYLYNLSNMAIITTLTDINHTDTESRVVKNDQYDENISTQQTSRDFVKLKDLIIAGKVWLDTDKDGYMGKNASGTLSSYIDYEANPSTHITPPSGDTEYAMKGIIVKLYDAKNPDAPIRTTKTNSDGLFTFGMDENGNWYAGTYSYDGAVTESEQRIPKATNKDTNKNYTANSEYIEYYIEYEYDGIAYKSTEIYSGTDNLKNDGSLASDKYKIDSNAKELKNIRDEFDLKHEIIGYNNAYDGSNSNPVNLEYEKDGHNSYLRIDHERVVTARSFIFETNASKLASDCLAAMTECGASKWKSCEDHWKNWQALIDSGYFDESQFTNTTQGRIEAQAYLQRLYNEVIKNLSNDGNTQVTKYLWLYKQAAEIDKPETEYLKYINLGLEEREDIDLSLTQDVYEVHNTVNGEEMTYWYNQNKYVKDGSTLDHDASTSEDYEAQFYMTRKKADSNNDDVAINPYQFKYYLADYNYKVDNYNIESVRDYKTQDSELDSEVTFRINVKNNPITDDEPYLSGTNKDIKVYAGVNEIVEYFDDDFVDITYNADGTVQTINVKTKDENGYLVNTPYKVADVKIVCPDGTQIPATMTGYNTSNDVKTMSATSIYNDRSNGATVRQTMKNNGYNTVYIRPNTDGVNNVILAEGEDLDILIKLTVGKDASRNLKLGLKTAIAEVSAYSTYYLKSDGTYYSAGLVDRDSNAGNFGETYNGVSFNKDTDNKANDPYLKLYEDDTYKTGIDLETQQDNERIIEGQVWDDARSEEAKTESGADTTDGIQYIGDGRNGTVAGIDNKQANDKARLNQAFDDKNKEKNDFKVNDVGVKLVELVRVPVDSAGNIISDSTGTIAEERIYEENILVNTESNSSSAAVSVMETRTGENGADEGKYVLKGYLPGEYTVRFFYGDKLSEQMLIFNGQDYKSTTYQNGFDEPEFTYADETYLTTENSDGTISVKKDSLGNPMKDTDTVLSILERPGLSDAKDDEIKRLETISYSETLNNNKTLILRGKNSTNKELQKDKTNMNAETTDFLVKTEKELSGTKTLSFQKTMNKFTAPQRHPIENVDFGLQYRPEQQVALNKFVKSLTITPSDSNGGTQQPLVDAKFNEFYGVVVSTDLESGVTKFLSYLETNDDGTATEKILKVNKDATTAQIEAEIRNHGLTTDGIARNPDGSFQVLIAGTEIDLENSIGVSNLQYVPNDKDTHDDDSIQGFVYLNIDDEIMQGTEIKIEYLFTANNISEVDRVNKNLSVLRFKDNMTAEQKAYYQASDASYNALAVDAMRAGGTLGSVGLITKVDSEGESVTYSGALTARNALFNEYYRYEIENIDPATATKDNKGLDVIYRIKHKTMGDTNNDYYGRYLGSTYYTGKVGANDIIAELKVDKILDYVDNNLVFKEEENGADTVDRFWGRVTTSELVLGGYVQPSILKFTEQDIQNALNSIDDETIKESIKVIQKYSDMSKLQIYLNTHSDVALSAIKQYTDLIAKGLLLDSDGVAYNTSERTNLAVSQDMRTSDAQTENDIVNASITKFITPRNTKTSASYGTIRILTSKVISAEDDTKDMTFENVGEIIQYSSVTGRVTTLSTTLGNVELSETPTPGDNPHNNSPEYHDSKNESDTASVEKVTLTPPTGLSRTSRIIQTAVKGASYVGVVTVVVAIIVIVTLGGIRIYRKRRIK